MNMSFLNGVTNLVEMIANNWTLIMIVIGLVITLVKKVQEYLKMTDEERVEAVKTLIRETILERVTNAEIEYQEWVQAGAIKRAQVIKEIYEAYPVLYKVVDQEKLIAWMDEAIDEALKTMREIIENNTEDKNETVAE